MLTVEVYYDKEDRNQHGFEIFMRGLQFHTRFLHQSNTWILLDSQFIVNIFCSPELLTNIKKIKKEMITIIQSGFNTTDWIGNLTGCIKSVWFDLDGIANVLSLLKIKQVYRINFDSSNDNKFIGQNKSSNVQFKEYTTNIYCNYTLSHTGTIRLVTVGDKHKHDNVWKLKQVKQTMKTQNTINFPFLRTYLNIVGNNLPENYLVAYPDIVVA